jgi:hypothetical protein
MSMTSNLYYIKCPLATYSVFTRRSLYIVASLEEKKEEMTYSGCPPMKSNESFKKCFFFQKLMMK